MSGHTKEPWPHEFMPRLENGSVILRKEDYARACACVNACAGIQTGALEKVTVVDILSYAGEAEEQRDELLAALKAVQQWMRDDDADFPKDGVIKAIASVEGGK